MFLDQGSSCAWIKDHHVLRSNFNLSLHQGSTCSWIKNHHVLGSNFNLFLYQGSVQRLLAGMTKHE